MQILYTTSESVRAALGITEREVSDAQMSALNLDIQVELDLDIVYPDHATAKTDAEGGSATDGQVRIFRLIRMYCQYQGACLMLPGFQNLIPQKLSDGGFEMQRFAKDDLDKTKAEIYGLRDKYKLALELVLDTDADSPTPIMATSTPQFNPVTNDGATT